METINTVLEAPLQMETLDVKRVEFSRLAQGIVGAFENRRLTLEDFAFGGKRIPISSSAHGVLAMGKTLSSIAKNAYEVVTDQDKYVVRS